MCLYWKAQKWKTRKKAHLSVLSHACVENIKQGEHSLGHAGKTWDYYLVSKFLDQVYSNWVAFSLELNKCRKCCNKFGWLAFWFDWCPEFLWDFWAHLCTQIQYIFCTVCSGIHEFKTKKNSKLWLSRIKFTATMINFVRYQHKPALMHIASWHSSSDSSLNWGHKMLVQWWLILS